MVSDLRAMQERMQQWMNEKPSFDGSGIELRFSTGDIVIGQFVAKGDEGDRYIKIYRSHIFPKQSQAGKRFNETRYCPRSSGDTADCPICMAGIVADVKERMSMYFYVFQILHSRPAEGKNWEATFYQGRTLFVEQVNGFKRWDTSAWRDSPWKAIGTLYDAYHGLNNFVFQLECTGQGTATRYSIMALPNTQGLAPEIYEQAGHELQPLGDYLRNQANQPVQAAPMVATAPAPTIGQPVFTGQPSFVPFTPPGAAAPPPFVPGVPNNTAAPATPISPPPFVPGVQTPATPPPYTPGVPGNSVPPTEYIPTSPPPEEPTAPPAEDNRRPMGRLF